MAIASTSNGHNVQPPPGPAEAPVRTIASELTDEQRGWLSEASRRDINGWLHVAIIYVLGGTAIWYCAHQIREPAWYEFLVVPLAFCMSNAFEWWIHRYLMHRPVKGFMGIYKRHTLAHHEFFTDVEPTLDDARDFRIVFFPPYALVAFMVISLVPAFMLGLLGLGNAAWLLMITDIGLYLNYELFHFCCHVKDDRIVRHIGHVGS